VKVCFSEQQCKRT